MSEPALTIQPLDHRTLFLSDLHLGAAGARADLLLRFLRRNRAETYILVGDILDVFHPARPHWTAAHEGVIAHLARRRAEGATILYLRGNHDPHPETAAEAFRVPAEPLDRIVHLGADGRRYLVLHGDAVDERTIRSHLLTRIGSRIDNALRQFDRELRRDLARYVRRGGPQRRSLIEWALKGWNRLSHPVPRHERRLVEIARAAGLDGVICGHFHMAKLHARHGLVYANCGDWLDSFTALAEDHQGRLRLLGGRTAFARAPRPVPALGGVARA